MRAREFSNEIRKVLPSAKPVSILAEAIEFGLELALRRRFVIVLHPFDRNDAR